MDELKQGFQPFFDNESKLLILGSFPSVKSRQTEFYYGNKLNRFWKTLSAYFEENEPLTIEEKKDFLKRRKIALWDIVTECEIEGSSDSKIKNFKVANVEKLLQISKINYIIINGSKAAEIFKRNFSFISTPFECLPSTSSANVGFKKECWFDALSKAFNRT